jgi:hypothetical protein
MVSLRSKILRPLALRPRDGFAAVVLGQFVDLLRIVLLAGNTEFIHFALVVPGYKGRVSVEARPKVEGVSSVIK